MPYYIQESKRDHHFDNMAQLYGAFGPYRSLATGAWADRPEKLLSSSASGGVCLEEPGSLFKGALKRFKGALKTVYT